MKTEDTPSDTRGSDSTNTIGQERLFSAASFRALVENNNAIIAVVDKDSNSVYRSSSSTRITGWAHHEFEKIDTTQFIHPEDRERARTYMEDALVNPGKSIPVKIRVLHKEGHFLWMEGSITNMLHDPDIKGIITNLQDVTARKIAEDKTQKALRLYCFISQINQMIVRVKDEISLYKEACTIAIKFGQFRMAWIGIIDDETQELIQVIHADEEKDFMSKMKSLSMADIPDGKRLSLLEKGYIIFNDIENDPSLDTWKADALKQGYLSCMCLPIKKSGKIIGGFYLYADTKYFFNEEEIVLLEEATGDINFAIENIEKDHQRKIAEEAVKESERRYHTLAEISPVGIFHTDAKGFTTYVNPRWCEISGLSSEEALGNGWFKALYEEDKRSLISGWEETIKTKKASRTEYRFLRPDGSIRWVMGEAIPEKNAANRILGYVGTITDITERKLAEVEIAAIFKDKETTLNRINDAMISVDLNWRYTFLNEAALATHPLPKEEIMGKTIWEIHPDMEGSFLSDKYHEAMKTGKAARFETYYQPMDKWFTVKIYPSLDGLTIIYNDISEGKKTEEKIRISELNLRKAQEIGKLGYWQLDLSTNLVWASKEAMRIYGFPADDGELKRETIAPCIIDRELVLAAETDLLEHGREFDIVFRINPADGSSMKYISSVAELERDGQGQPLRVVGILQDITERIKAQEEILNERNLSDSIINSLPGVFYLYTKEGRFLRWNQNFEKITQYTAEEISRMHPYDFFHSSEKELAASKIDNTFIQGEDYLQADFLLKTKERIPYYFTGKAIDYGGNSCLAGVGIDFTDRVKAQEQIKQTTEQLRMLTAHLQQIREEERKRIGREIHDELGQQLTAIKMDIAWLDKKITDDGNEFKRKLKNIIELLDGSNQSIRRILSELRPGALDDSSLTDALEWLGKQFTASSGIPLSFTSTGKNVQHSDSVVTCIFRVYQEALTNITRYAGATMVSASLTISEETITLSVEDNGKGFAPESVQTHKSFGILGMKERVISLGGVFELTSSPGKGTRIWVKLRNDITDDY